MCYNLKKLNSVINMKGDQKVSRLQDRLAEALRVREIRAIRLSEETGVPKGAISYYLNGKSTPKPDRLRLICEVLNVSETWMLGYDVPMDISLVEDTNMDFISNETFINVKQETLDFAIFKSIDILQELKLPEETLKQLIVKHFDIRYSEITKILKQRLRN